MMDTAKNGGFSLKFKFSSRSFYYIFKYYSYTYPLGTSLNPSLGHTLGKRCAGARMRTGKGE